MAERLATDLAGAGVVIVSGLAIGVDTAAHEGALLAGGCTVAVLGSGVDVVYPAANADLARRLLAAGGRWIGGGGRHDGCTEELLQPGGGERELAA